MPSEYEILIRDPAGALQAIIPGRGFIRLEYVREVNGAGLALFDIPSNHTAIPYLEDDGIVEIRWRDVAAGVTWYTDFGGLYADYDRWTDGNGLSMFRAYCTGYLDLLGGETVAYPANTANRSYFSAQPAETIMKTLVAYNAVTASATVANGRDYTTDVAGVTVATDGGFGNTLTRDFAGQNLLAALQDTAEVGGGDFDLVRTTGAAWQFRWYTGQRGTDRTASVVFSLGYKNMESPKLTRNRLLERTRVVVLGQGEEGTRARVVRTGANYDAGGRNRTIYVSTNETATAALNAAGDLRLRELEARSNLDFVVRQTAARMYRRDYFLGDLVRANYEDIVADKQIIQAAIVVEQTGDRTESITIKTKNA